MKGVYTAAWIAVWRYEDKLDLAPKGHSRLYRALSPILSSAWEAAGGNYPAVKAAWNDAGVLAGAVK